MPPKNVDRKRATRGGRTRARLQLTDSLKPPKSLLDVTPKTPHYSRIAEQNIQESTLLRLPPELRNRIWTYILSTKNDITPDMDGIDFKKWNREEIHLDVIGVCRQTYAETARLPFALGCFSFRDVDRMQQLLLRTSPDQRWAIARIKLPCYCLAEYLSWSYDYPLEEFPRLASVGVWCVRDKCTETNSTGDVVGRLRNMAGKPELKVYFLDWRAPDF